MHTTETQWFGSLLLASLLLLPSALTAQHFPSDDELELTLRFISEDKRIPGLVLGLLEPGGAERIVSFGGGGGSRPLGARTIFDIGSIGKTFTATLLADMVLKGEVALDDPISKYLPEHVTVPSYRGREITLVDLATHTSGLPRMPANARSAPVRGNVGYTVEDAYQFLSSHRLTREPGGRYLYSNIGYGLLGHILGLVAGTSYEELIRTRILEPLEMTWTVFEVEGELTEWMARGHHGSREVAYEANVGIFNGAGGLRSNITDMLKYMRAQTGPPSTDLEQAMRLAHEIRVVNRGDGSGYGLAWNVRVTPRGERAIFHTGGASGFSAQFILLPDAETGAVLLTNRFGNQDATFPLTLLTVGPPPPDRYEVPVAEEVLARYVGEYTGDRTGRFYLRLEEQGFLTYQPEGHVRTRLHATSDTTFFHMRGAATFTLRPERNGEGVELVMTSDERSLQPGSERSARRVSTETPPPAVVAGSGAGLRSAQAGWLALPGALLLVAFLTVRRSRERGSTRAVASTN